MTFTGSFFHRYDNSVNASRRKQRTIKRKPVMPWSGHFDEIKRDEFM